MENRHQKRGLDNTGKEFKIIKENLKRYRKKKKNQNKAYKEKQKRKRILDAEFNDDFKIKQRKWKQASRKRRAEQKKKEGCTPIQRQKTLSKVG